MRRRRDHRRTALVSGNDLQVRCRRNGSGWRQVDHHRRQQNERSRDAVPRARTFRRADWRPLHYDALEARGILYAPDYVANSGGVLGGGADLFGWPPEKVRAEVLAIYDTILSIFEIAKAKGIPTYKAADRLAERRLLGGVEHCSAR